MQLWRHIDRMIGFSSDDHVADAFSRERLQAVRGGIHLYYLTILVPYFGYAWFTSHETVTQVAGIIFLLAVVLRFRHWSMPQSPEKSEDVNAVTARVTGAMVVLLSVTQAVFYIMLAKGAAGAGTDAMAWAPILAVGILSALIQSAVLTGIVFASRVIFFCLVMPQVLAVVWFFAGHNIPATVAIVTLTGISFFLSEASHKVQLRLFDAQMNADAALRRMEKTNVELGEARRQAQALAETDGLTGVHSRFAFIQEVEKRLALGHAGMLAIIDLTRFKPINDLYGHNAGDVVLRHVARRLQRALPEGSIVGRLGGDEFGVFIGGTGPAEKLGELVALCNDALHKVRRPMRLSSALISIGGSAGARLVGLDITDVGRAMLDADAALFVAKREGLEGTKLFDDAIREEKNWMKTLEGELLKSSTISQMSLVYQPIFNLRTGELASFEALARWEHPEFGEISPSIFIPAAERLGRIGEITLALLKSSLAFAASWDPPVRLSFNLSAAHICCEDAAREIVDILAARDFPLERLQFEITETAMLVNFDMARANIETLRKAGCRIALDDFGAGFASLVYLREIQFDKVKIDGSLVRNAREEQGRAMLGGVIRMFEAMDLECVAEYIESESDHETALSLGAEFGQGFELGMPMREADVCALLERHQAPRSSNIHSLVARGGGEDGMSSERGIHPLNFPDSRKR